MKIALAFLLFTVKVSSAQQLSLAWFKVAGGDGTSSGGVFSVSGTIGQHDAGGPLAGGSYSLTGGFWSYLTVVQTSGAPRLFITHSGTSTVISWQNLSGWALQQNNDLTLSSNWSASSGVSMLGGTNYLNVTSPTGNLFFRLFHQ